MSNTLEYVMKLSAGAFTGPLAKARDEQGRFIREGKQIAGTTKEVGNLGSAFGGLTTKILAAFTAWKAGAALFSGVAKSLNMAAEMESTNVAFKTLVGNAVKAADVLGKIKKLGAETPFEFPELANAGRMLIAFGESSETVTETLRRIGDVASGIKAPIGEIAEIYGKARTQGTLFAEDINQLTGRGIPIIGQFARILNVSESAVKDLASQGKITFPLLDQAFRNLTASGGQFFNMMEEQSATNKGLMSSLSDVTNELYLSFGQPLNDALKPMLKDAISLAGSLQPLVAAIGTSAGTVVTAFRDFVANIGAGTGAFDQLLSSMGKAIGGLGDVVAVPLNAIKAALPGLATGLMVMLEPLGTWLSKTLEAGALHFGRTMMQQMSEVMAKMPPMLVGDAPAQLNASANASGKAGNAARAEAGDAASRMKPAADMAMRLIGDALKSATSTFGSGLDQLAGKAKDEAAGSEASRIVREGRNKEAPEVKTTFDDELAQFYKGKKGVQIAPSLPDKAPGLDAAIAGNSASQAKPSDPFGLKKYQIPAAKAREATDMAFRSMGASDEPGDDRAANGRKRIISKRDGTTKAKTREQDSLYKPFGTPGFDSLYGGKVPNVKLTPPGTAKRQDTERRETAATQSRAGGGGGEKPRWDVVAQIEKHLANLATA